MMLEILEQKNTDAYREILDGIVSTGQAVPLHVSEAREAETVKGYIIYAYQPQQVVIYVVSDGGDWNQCDGLVRSVLFKAQLRGIQQALFLEQDTQMTERLAKLGFMKNNQKKLDNIMDIMENCKKCKENPVNT